MQLINTHLAILDEDQLRSHIKSCKQMIKLIKSDVTKSNNQLYDLELSNWELELKEAKWLLNEQTESTQA